MSEHRLYVRELHGFSVGGDDHWVIRPYCKWKPWHWWKKKFTLPTPGAVTNYVERRKN